MTHAAQTDLGQASDARTAARDLERLAVHRDTAVRAAVARNPNAPLSILERLSVRHAAEVFQNPLIDLLGLEDSRWLSALPEFSRLALLRHPACPVAWLSWALESGEVRNYLAVAQNPATPKSLLEKLRDDDSTRETAPGAAAGLHVALHEHEQTRDAEAWLIELGAKLECDAEALKDALAARVAPVWLLTALALGDDLELSLLIARRPDVPAAALEALLFHADEDVRNAARARNLPVELQDFLNRTNASLSREDAARLLRFPHGRWLVARFAPMNHNLERADFESPDFESPDLESLFTAEDWRVRLALAQNESLEAQQLAKLGADADKDVRAAVAAHPQTSRSVLARLMLDDHEDVRIAARGNPAAPWGLGQSLEKLETGDLSLSAATLERLSRRDEGMAILAAAHVSATLPLLRSLAGHDGWKVRQAVARNRMIPADILEKLAADSDYDVRAAVTLHPNVTPRLLETLSRDPHPLVRSGVALGARAAPTLLERLVGDDDADVRQAVAVNPNVSVTLLERLSVDDHDGVRRAVALHALTSPELLERLSTDTDADVRGAVADHPNAPASCGAGIFGAEIGDLPWKPLYARLKNGGEVSAAELRALTGLNEFAQTLALKHPNCPADLLERFATDDDWHVRQAVAQHPKAASALLEVLSADGDHDVREAVARHAATDGVALQKLCRDDHAQVRKALAERADVSPEIAQTLAWDDDDDVLKSLEARGGAGAELRHHASSGVRLEPDALAQLRAIGTPLALRLLAGNAGTSAETLAALCNDPETASDWRVRQAVAGNENANAATLELLCADSDNDVRRGVAANPNAGAQLLERALCDDDASVRRAAMENPGLSDAARAAVRRAVLTRNLSLRGLNRVLALEHPALPATEYAKRRNLHALSWLERLALSRNPAIPRAALELLCHDANRAVRESARAVLESRAVETQGQP